MNDAETLDREVFYSVQVIEDALCVLKRLGCHNAVEVVRNCAAVDGAIGGGTKTLDAYLHLLQHPFERYRSVT